MWMALSLPSRTSRSGFPYRRNPLVPHRHHQDRGPRPRGRRAPPAAGSPCPSRSTARPSSSAARPPGCSSGCPTGSTRSSSTRRPGRSATTTTTAPGATEQQLDRFLQAYAVEKARIEARKKGHAVTEQSLADGSIKLTIRGRRWLHEDHRDHRRPEGRDEGRDEGLHRRRVPRGQPVRRAGPRPADRREADRRVPPGPGRRPAAQAVAADRRSRLVHLPTPASTHHHQQGDHP